MANLYIWWIKKKKNLNAGIWCEKQLSNKAAAGFLL